MTETLLVTATADGTGKTAVAIALGLIAADRGLEVGYMKPKGTRLRSHAGTTRDEDPVLARELLDLEDDVEDMSPIVYSSTFVREAIRGREDPEQLRSVVTERFESIAADRDLVIVEGGTSTATGQIIDLADPVLAEVLDAETVVLAGFDRPEGLDDLLTTVEHLNERLRGLLFNDVSSERHDELEGDVVPFLEGRSIEVHGSIPRDRALAGVTVENLADDLGGRIVTDVSTDSYVERFVVGAMSADSALRYFRRTRDAAVITGGDRPAIQTAALEASGVKCVILTGGYRPERRVVGIAEEKGVPLLLTQADTLSTIDRAEAIVSEGRTRDEATVERMRALLTDHADVEALLGVDGLD